MTSVPARLSDAEIEAQAAEHEKRAAIVDLLTEPGCKDRGCDVGAWGECLICSAEAGVACRGQEQPVTVAVAKPRKRRRLVESTP
jgi:hypothetical protein